MMIDVYDVLACGTHIDAGSAFDRYEGCALRFV
jgi:hypothetical protein